LVRIALDAMGGDHAPSVVVEGAVLAAQQLGVHVILVGPDSVVASELNRFPGYPKDLISIVHAPDVVGMSESPAISFRQKKNSSIQVGLKLVKEGHADGFVSAGNTGAVMMASTLVLGRIPGIERPAIASLIPTKANRPVVVLDMGASVDCKPEHLAQFATMGSYFAQSVFNTDTPRVGLLSNGEEPEKGNQAVQGAFELIKSMPLNFIGNVEGKDILDGVADVVVCDGFVGNVILKFGEGISSALFGHFKEAAKGGCLRSKLGLLLLKPLLKSIHKKYDYEEYGGAPLLGVNGVSIISHGRSSAIAIKNAIRLASNDAKSNLVEKINKAMNV
jgi:glycerol-3-phosphate acyltransferase PlsX